MGSTSVVLNTAFLFLVLFYVHPLRFLTQLIELPIAMMTGNEELKQEVMSRINAGDIAELMLMYGFGAAAVFFILAAMYHFALKKSDELELNELENFDTKSRRTQNLLMGSVPLISAFLALFMMNNPWAGFACGMTYTLYTPIMMVWGKKVEKGRKLILAKSSTPTI
jgi:hypothetical protein